MTVHRFLAGALAALTLVAVPAHGALRFEAVPAVLAKQVLHGRDVAAKRQNVTLPADVTPHDWASVAVDELVVAGQPLEAPGRLMLRTYRSAFLVRGDVDLGPWDAERARGASAKLAIDGHGRAWIADPSSDQVWVVEAERELRAVKLEAAPLAIAWNRANNTLVAGMRNGQLAVLSPSGERLDTLPAFRPSDQPMTLSIDAATGDLYALHANDDMAVRVALDRAAGLANLTDLWLPANEQGWGAFVEQQGTTMFVALFTHNARGEPVWLVMSNGARQPDGSFSGVLYRTRGGSGVLALPAGLLRISAAPDGKATLTYVVDGLSQTRVMERFSVDGKSRVCGWETAGDKLGGNLTGLWSNPADPGWGVAIAQRGNAAFGVLFTYDEQDRPTWMVLSNGRVGPKGIITGDLHKASKTRLQSSGTMTMRLGAAGEGALTYRIDGIEFRSSLLRQVAAGLVSRCEP